MGGLFLIDNDYNFLIHEADGESGFAAGDYLKGDMHLVNDIWCACIKDWEIARDTAITMITKSKQMRGTKTAGTGEGINEGDLVYWDNTNEVVTTTAGSNPLIGHCIRQATDADTTVDIDFDGRLHNLV